MTGLTLLGRDDQTVRVALDDRVMAQGLGDLRWRLPQLLAGGTDTLVVDVAEVDRLSSTAIATLLWSSAPARPGACGWSSAARATTRCGS